MSITFSRTTLFCRDIEKSLQLYRDTLGLHVIDDKALEGPAAGALLGLGPCTLRIVLLADDGKAIRPSACSRSPALSCPA